MTFWKILGVGILIPIVTPLFLSAYIVWAPGEMIGTIDGWLGYLGGYSGGFLAFISAYFIFQRDQKARNKTVLNIRTCPTAEAEVLSVKYHAYFTSGNIEGVKLEIATGRVAGVENYPTIIVQIKNICSNYATSINLIVGKNNLKPLMYIKGQNFFTRFDSMTELESKETFEFALHIDPHLWNGTNNLSCTLSSYNLLESENKQSVELHKGSAGGLTFESKN